MKDHARRIVEGLEQIPDVVAKDMPSRSRYKIMSRAGVLWNRESREDDPKWGNVHYESNHVLIALDYPKGHFTEEEVSQLLKLPIRKSRERKTGIHIFLGASTSPYDSLRIKLYEADAKDEPMIGRLLQFADDLYRLSS
ncbi:hypothetical protein P9314_11060 [Paenibacillus validus]|uniref:hypothetical protein n=1 Tax=Paenibacillus validus TaxID=44253 RepID=UPI000FD9C333|nr:hypothetical protein [Paenibacillus validus]MED4601244.1 hypothetical protein [Paenibacillus validus]MED4607504.1 hypothetical protein [Paenibacillus validus]